MAGDLVPRIDEFRPAVIRVLSDGKARSAKDVCQAVADLMGLSDKARSQQIASGQLRYVNRINWACSGLAQAGLVNRPKRGWYEITSNGRIVDGRSLSAYSENDMLEWPMWQAYQQELADRKAGQPATTVEPLDDDPDAAPIEVLEAGQQAFNARTETELRQKLQAASPEFFESAVVELLWKMGYGGTHGEKQRVGKSGDGGIDGIIRQDALGLDNVYIQAKRYADTNTVGSPEIRNFIGALDSKGAGRGVFITTSTFAPAATTTAAGYRHGKIILIDGIRLTALMLAYGVAVQKVREFVLYEIDEDFFDTDLT